MLESLHALYAALAAKLPALGPWLAPLAFVLAFVKSLPLVALFIPGTALLLSIGAAIRLSEAGFVDVWLAISLGAALGDWVSFALGVWAGPRVMHWNWLRQRPHMVLRAAAFVQRWGVLSIVLCRFFGPLRATVPLAAGVSACGRPPSRQPIGHRPCSGRPRCWPRAGWAANGCRSRSAHLLVLTLGRVDQAAQGRIARHQDVEQSRACKAGRLASNRASAALRLPASRARSPQARALARKAATVPLRTARPSMSR